MLPIFCLKNRNNKNKILYILILVLVKSSSFIRCNLPNTIVHRIRYISRKMYQHLPEFSKLNSIIMFSVMSFHLWHVLEIFCMFLKQENSSLNMFIKISFGSWSIFENTKQITLLVTRAVCTGQIWNSHNPSTYSPKCLVL